MQLYIHQRYGSAARPVRELKGFQRVTLEPGERRTVQFTLGPQQLRYWNAQPRATGCRMNRRSTCLSAATQRHR
ncbi:MAG: fibronectin type III-like domain-contianing protein [Rhodopseudomonas palustris]|nr:fibronectin type III-like domain-contianing protein [Rhodopseudomonas palustris]